MRSPKCIKVRVSCCKLAFRFRIVGQPSLIGKVRFARRTTPIRRVPFESRPPTFRWHLLRVLLLTAEVAGWHDSAARRKATEARSLGTSRSLLRCQAHRLSATQSH